MESGNGMKTERGGKDEYGFNKNGYKEAAQYFRRRKVRIKNRGAGQ